MTITLTPKLEKALSEEAQRQGTTPERLALDCLSEMFTFEDSPLAEKYPEGSAFDLFDGLLEQVSSGGEGHWSEDTGRKFAEGMAEKWLANGAALEVVQ